MKVGDTVPVTIGGHEVAQAVVKELNDGTAVLVVPATRVEFGTKTELTDLPERRPVGGAVEILGSENNSTTNDTPDNNEAATSQSEQPGIVNEVVAPEVVVPAQEQVDNSASSDAAQQPQAPASESGN